MKKSKNQSVVDAALWWVGAALLIPAACILFAAYLLCASPFASGNQAVIGPCIVLALICLALALLISHRNERFFHKANIATVGTTANYKGDRRS